MGRFEAYPYLGELCFVPTVWAAHVVRKAFDDEQVVNGAHDGGSSYAAVTVLEALRKFRCNKHAVCGFCVAILALRVFCLRDSHGNFLFEIYLPIPFVLSQVPSLCFSLLLLGFPLMHRSIQTQVVTFAVYCYFLTVLFAQQELSGEAPT